VVRDGDGVDRGAAGVVRRGSGFGSELPHEGQRLPGRVPLYRRLRFGTV
jgi:hypothetical protein